MADKYANISALTEFLSKIKAWANTTFATKASLSTVATSGSYNDLSNKPTIPAAVAVKGDSETTYRTGNVNLTKANIGLGNVGNFKAVSTVASQGLTNTEKSNARTNIGAGTSSFSGSYNDLTNKPTIPAEVTESTVSGWGFTKNAGTITGITMNGASKGTSGVVNLGTVITAHQDISGKQDKITPITAQTTQAVYPIKIDAQGHITAYGSAQTIPTQTSQLTNNSGYITNSSAIYESRLNWGNSNISGNISPVDAGCVDEFGHNKLAFLDPACINAAYSTNGGSTWTDYGLSDTDKINLVTGTDVAVSINKGATPSSSNITQLKSRVRIAAQKTNGTERLYTAAKKWLLNITTRGNGNCTITMRYRTIANAMSGTETWITVGTYNVSGYSGWNSIPWINNVFGGSTSSQTGQPGEVEFVMSAGSYGSPGGSAILGIRLIGATNWVTPSEMARVGHLYTFDMSKNATFPNAVTATDFIGKNNGFTLGMNVPSGSKLTDTHRPIQVNGTQNLGDNTTALNLKNGSNVSISASGGDVTIAATDTTYESKAAASGGTAVSLVTTGEKYTWNNKGTVSHNTDVEAGSAVTLNADQIQGYSLNALIDLFYPVGSIYSSTVSTSPAELFGRGTWVAIEGRFLIGVGSATDIRSDTRSFTNGQTGGEWAHVLSTDEMPSHNHGIVTEYGATANGSLSPGNSSTYSQIAGSNAASKVNNTYSIQSNGSGNAHNNVPPYLAVYMWKRTA